jgi:methyl-accepting chemotaxis protein
MPERNSLFLKIAALLLLQNSLLATSTVVLSADLSTAMMALLAAGVIALSVTTAMMATRLTGASARRTALPAAPYAPEMTPSPNASFEPEVAEPNKESGNRRPRLAPMDSADAKRLGAAEVALNALDGALRRLAVGDLAVRLDVPFAVHLEPLRADFNRALSAISDAMAAMTSSSDRLHAACSEARFVVHQQEANASTDNPILLAASTGLDDAARSLHGQERDLQELALFVGEMKLRHRQAGNAADRESGSLADMDGRLCAVSTRMRDTAFQASMLAVEATTAAAERGSAEEMLRIFARQLREIAENGADAAKEALVLERDLAHRLADARDTIDHLTRGSSATASALEQLEQKLGSAAESMDNPAALLSGTASTLAELARCARQRDVVRASVEGALDRMTQEIATIDRHCGRFIPVTVLQESSPPEGHPPRPHHHLRLIKS